MFRARVRVLVVDDEPSIRKTLADILADQGHDVSVAADGKLALELCADREFDVILLDVQMPVMNGVDCFENIRRLQQDAKVIFMSAFGGEDLKQAVLQQGAIAFLDKPLDVDLILRLINQTADSSVLIVTADVTFGAHLSQALNETPHRASLALSGHEALRLARQIRFDIILIDVELAGRSGLALYVELRKISPDATAIMLTNEEKESQELAEEAVRRTAYTILRKPVDRAELIKLTDRIYRQRVSNAIQKPDLE